MKLAALALALHLSACSTWSPGARAAFTFNFACHALDLAQTERALDSGKFREANPLLGSHPSDGALVTFKVAAIGVAYVVAESAPRHRSAALVVSTVPCLAAVAHNYSEGARP